MSKGNALAYIILLLWPLISIRLYQKKTIQEATLWVLLGGFMLLPVLTEVDFPLVPPLGKHSMPALSVIIGCWFIKGKSINYFKHTGLLKILSLSILVLPFITAELNTDRIVMGGMVLPALTHHDALSAVINKILFMSPFFIGLQFYKSYQDQLLMFKVLVLAGLCYTIPILYETRMSPQLHSIFYGYFPHSWVQQRRAGGFRAVVFMGHGLLVAFFIACVLTAISALWKVGEKVHRFSLGKMRYYLLVVLVLCKSMAALMYGVFTFIMICVMPYKMQFRAAIFLACLSVLYPTLSIIKVFPHQQLGELASTYLGPERAQSLVYRFDNEHRLVEHARKRFFFGWGGWGRNKVYDEDTGENLTVTDGRWIIVFGKSGWLGFSAEFFIMALSIFRAKTATKLIKDKQQQTLLAAHALIVGILMIDQLPNSSLAPWLWLLVGILLSRSEAIITESKIISRKR